MCGPQVGIIVKDNHDLLFYYNFYSFILDRIHIVCDEYDSPTELISSVNILYYELDVSSIINTLKAKPKLTLNRQI
jgi:hypothetical protein